MTIKFTVEGDVEVNASMTTLAKLMGEIPMEDLGALYVRVTASLAPVDTGKLAGSIRPVNRKNSTGAIATAPYSMFVNYGTRFVSATHFMNRADAILADDTLRLVEAGVDDLIEKVDLQP